MNQKLIQKTKPEIKSIKLFWNRKNPDPEKHKTIAFRNWSKDNRLLLKAWYWYIFNMRIGILVSYK